MTGGGNRIVRNEISGNGWVGFEDRAVPGSNIYADNICIGNRGGGSEPEGLCDDSVPPGSEPATEPSDNADAAGDVTAEE